MRKILDRDQGRSKNRSSLSGKGLKGWVGNNIYKMTAEEFKQIWKSEDDNCSSIHPELLGGLNLKPSTVNFLTVTGLPIEAAPFLSFTVNANAFEPGINKLPEIFDFLESEFDKYIVIGSDGNGDLIAINTESNDQIEWLDHEDNFSSRFFNTSINSLAESLVIYRDFVQSILEENGEDAFINSNFTDAQFEALQQKLRTADEKAISEDGFWKQSLEVELALREDKTK
jgi:hypothetical protein